MDELLEALNSLSHNSGQGVRYGGSYNPSELSDLVTNFCDQTSQWNEFISTITSYSQHGQLVDTVPAPVLEISAEQIVEPCFRPSAEEEVPDIPCSINNGGHNKPESDLSCIPDQELKELPAHLEYVFLDNNPRFPVIISSTLDTLQKRKLIELLQLHRKAIAWSISDIKGINPSFCTHKILMEDNSKPRVQPQRRLNPHMMEVVKKEVKKLLDAGIIFPISDSPWVSPVQVVPKKGGTTVISNEHNELIPSRTVTG